MYNLYKLDDAEKIKASDLIFSPLLSYFNISEINTNSVGTVEYRLTPKDEKQLELSEFYKKCKGYSDTRKVEIAVFSAERIHIIWVFPNASNLTVSFSINLKNIPIFSFFI